MIKIDKPDLVTIEVPPKIQEKIIEYLIIEKIPFINEKPFITNYAKVLYFYKKYIF